MIIDNFYNWFLTLKTPSDCELEIEKINFDNDFLNNTLKKSIAINLINDQHIGKFVVWDDNSCFLEILEIVSEENVLHERYDFKNLDELELNYKKFEEYFR